MPIVHFRLSAVHTACGRRVHGPDRLLLNSHQREDVTCVACKRTTGYRARPVLPAVGVPITPAQQAAVEEFRKKRVTLGGDAECVECGDRFQSVEGRGPVCDDCHAKKTAQLYGDAEPRQYRCTRTLAYPPGSLGYSDRTVRQGYYMHARCRSEALAKMAESYPRDVKALSWEQAFTAEVMED